MFAYRTARTVSYLKTKRIYSRLLLTIAPAWELVPVKKKAWELVLSSFGNLFSFKSALWPLGTLDSN